MNLYWALVPISQFEHAVRANQMAVEIHAVVHCNDVDCYDDTCVHCHHYVCGDGGDGGAATA